MVQRGTYISGFGHAGFILWALLGGFFLSAREPLPVQSSDVSLITSEQFAALALPDVVPDVQVDSAQPVAPEIEEAAPEIAPEPEETPPVEVNEPVPAPAQPVAEESPVLPEAAPDQPPKPAPSPRIAPEPAAPPPPDAEIADEVTPEVVPDEGGETVAEEAPATAPEEAATEIVTEAEQPAAAPDASPRPTARPSPPVQVAEEAPEPGPEPETEPANDPVADAVAEAVASDTTSPAAPTGPPLTGGEKDALRVGVQKCWNVGSLSSEALSTTVVVTVTMQRNGKPDNGSIRMQSFEGGSEASADQAFRAAQRAIIRCGFNGFDLPVEKYSHWQEIEMTFNPESMRIK